MNVPLWAWPLVGVAGAAGAVARVVVGAAVEDRAADGFPAGTLAVNLSGTFVLGVVAGAGVASTPMLLAGTALIGSYTTFSTLIYETERLAEEGDGRPAVLNLAATLVLGLVAVAAGWLIGGTI